jgi:hypothetical protein
LTTLRATARTIYANIFIIYYRVCRLVEINSTFYRGSDPTTIRRRIDRVTDHFAFRFTAVNAEIIRQRYAAAYTKYQFR